MAVLPRTIDDLLSFAVSHADWWAERAPEIGLPEDKALEFRALTELARAAKAAAYEAEEAKKSAFLAQQSAMAALKACAAQSVALIKAFAETQPQPSTVFATAHIQEPASPSPTPEPGTPTRFDVDLRGDGTLTLTWACRNPRGSSGTMYEVRRSVTGATGPFEFLATVGGGHGGNQAKSYTDATLPAGSTNVVYMVTAVRSTRRGQPGLHSVNFGVMGLGGAGSGLKMAA